MKTRLPQAAAKIVQPVLGRLEGLPRDEVKHYRAVHCGGACIATRDVELAIKPEEMERRGSGVVLRGGKMLDKRKTMQQLGNHGSSSRWVQGQVREWREAIHLLL